MGAAWLVASALSLLAALVPQSTSRGLSGVFMFISLVTFVVFLAKRRRSQWARALDAYDHARAGRHGRALREYDRVLAKFKAGPGDSSRIGLLHAWKAISLSALGRADEAMAASELAMRLGHGEAQVNAIRALVLLRAGRDDEAVRLAETAVSLDPGNAHAHACHAEVLRRTGRLDASLAAIDRAISLAQRGSERREWQGMREEILGTRQGGEP